MTQSAEIARSQEWISVATPPEDPGPYLVWCIDNPYPTTRIYDGDSWHSTAEITHWMPLPEPPRPQRIAIDQEGSAR